MGWRAAAKRIRTVGRPEGGLLPRVQYENRVDFH